MPNHYDWKNGKQTCPSCGWTGLGSETEIGETFGEGADYHCPKCDYRFGFIAYPLLSESLSDPRAPESDRVFAEIVTRNAGHPKMESQKAPKIALFARVLLNNSTWLMTISWLGLGKLQVSHFPSGQSAVAPRWLKSHFISTMHELSKLGVQIHPSNPAALEAMEAYAQFVINPNGILARTTLSQSPDRLAQFIQQQSAE